MNSAGGVAIPYSDLSTNIKGLCNGIQKASLLNLHQNSVIALPSKSDHARVCRHGLRRFGIE